MIKAQMHFQDYMQTLMRRRWVVITFFVVVVVSVLIGSLKQTPVYESSATLLIDRRMPQVLSMQEVVPMGLNDYHSYKEYYETQYQLIKSRTLLKKVADSLGLKSSDTDGKKISPVDRLMKSVKVVPVKKSQLVRISVEDPDPELAAGIANTLADEYIRQNLERNIKVSGNAAEWLTGKIEEQRQKLKAAELALSRYRTRHNISILPQSGEESAVEDIKAEYARLQALLASYSKRYTNEHPRVIELKAQIRSLRNKIDGLEGVDSGNKTMEFRVLEREVQSNKHMYESLLERLKEIDLSSTLNVNNISIIDRARVPVKPVKPNIPLNMVLSVMAGLVMGAGLGFFVDYLDTTVKSPQDVKDVLESYFLGSIPKITGSDKSKKDRLVHIRPHSPISEAYRAIRTEILYLMPKDKSLAVLVTSAEPRAGKTITATNLALALCQMGNSVLLVDSDLRKPQVHKVFNVDRIKGFSDYLKRKRPFNEIIKDTDVDGLKIVTSGKVPSNPAEIISSSRAEEFIKEAKQSFDYVLFDSPPVASVSDSVILASRVDATLQVVRSGEAPVQVVLRAKEKLANTGTEFLGVVLNDIKTYHGDYYAYKYYRYYGEGNRDRSPVKQTSSI